MKKLLKALLVLSGLTVALPLHAQTILSQTTLSAAVTSTSALNIVVASTTCTACTGSVLAAGANIYVDRELMVVLAVNSTTLRVQRGASGTTGGTHASGALVFMGPPAGFPTNPRVTAPTNGSCTRGNEIYLPAVQVSTGIIADCVGGQWIKGLVTSGATTASRFRVYAPEPGAVAYTGINSTGTATIATEVYCSEVWLPTSKNLTGMALLAGTANSTDKHYVILYDNTGNAIANSALAGATGNTTASAYQQYAFTSPYFAVGPAQYFACFQSNGTTDTVRMAVTGVNDNILTKGQTGATFGTIPALTVPTTFTTAVGPYVYLY